jgi:hypothetical protein
MGKNKHIDLEGVHVRINVEGARARLTRGEAAALIASKVKEEDESLTTARNRIGMQLDRSLARGYRSLDGRPRHRAR